MTFIGAVQSVFGKYATFTGRARRSELWWFLLFDLLVSLVVGMIDGVIRSSLLGVLVTLGFFLPVLAVEVRRLHDIGKSGWWILISFIPILGIILLIVWWCQDSEAGDNRFGPNPKRAAIDAAVFDATPPPTRAI